MNVLLDTNVLIDYLGKQQPFFENAEKVVAAGYFGDAKLWTPAASLKDAFYVLSRYVEPLKVQQAMAKLLDVVSLVGISPKDAERALRLGWEDYGDCLVALCAESANADYLITRDSKGFERSMVPSISPSEWLALMEREYRLTYAGVSL